MVGFSLGLLLALRMWRGGGDLFRAAWERKGLLLLFVFLANAPDLDYLPGLISGDFNHYHHLITHSLGWVLVFSLGIWLVWRGLDRRAGVRDLLFVFLATSSHLVVDLLTQDGTPPYGILLWWPVSSDYVHLPFWVFGMMAKDNVRMIFQVSNYLVMLKEIVLVAPATLLVLLLRFK